MATRDRHGAMWVNTCHADCCSWQGLQEILHTVYRNERDLTKVKIWPIRHLSQYVRYIVKKIAQS